MDAGRHHTIAVVKTRGDLYILVGSRTERDGP